MTAYDAPSFDGIWNLDNRCSTWWAPYELYDRENLCADIIGFGYKFLYENQIDIKNNM